MSGSSARIATGPTKSGGRSARMRSIFQSDDPYGFVEITTSG